MFPKPITLRDQKYLAWLREQPCSWCGGRPPSDPAHQGGGRGVASKAPDDHAIPLCRRCHRLTGESFTPNNVQKLRSLARSGLAFWWSQVELTFASFREWAAAEGAVQRFRYKEERR